MKTIKLFGLLILTVIFSNCSENKNSGNDEQEVRDLIARYDEAAMKNE